MSCQPVLIASFDVSWCSDHHRCFWFLWAYIYHLSLIALVQFYLVLAWSWSHCFSLHSCTLWATFNLLYAVRKCLKVCFEVFVIALYYFVSICVTCMSLDCMWSVFVTSHCLFVANWSTFFRQSYRVLCTEFSLFCHIEVYVPCYCWFHFSAVLCMCSLYRSAVFICIREPYLLYCLQSLIVFVCLQSFA